MLLFLYEFISSIAFACNAKSFEIVFLVFLFLLHPVLRWPGKSFFANVISIVIQNTCHQYWANFIRHTEICLGKSDF